CNVTSNATAAWTLQQLREAIASDHPYRFLVHDRDSIYTQAPDTSIANLRLRVLKTPYRSPKANSLCEPRSASSPRARLRVVRSRSQLIEDRSRKSSGQGMHIFADVKSNNKNDSPSVIISLPFMRAAISATLLRWNSL